MQRWTVVSAFEELDRRITRDQELVMSNKSKRLAVLEQNIAETSVALHRVRFVPLLASVDKIAAAARGGAAAATKAARQVATPAEKLDLRKTRAVLAEISHAVLSDDWFVVQPRTVVMTQLGADAEIDPLL